MSLHHISWGNNNSGVQTSNWWDWLASSSCGTLCLNKPGTFRWVLRQKIGFLQLSLHLLLLSSLTRFTPFLSPSSLLNITTQCNHFKSGNQCYLLKKKGPNKALSQSSCSERMGGNYLPILQGAAVSHDCWHCCLNSSTLQCVGKNAPWKMVSCFKILPFHGRIACSWEGGLPGEQGESMHL